jgi:hypothetical protein
VYSDVEYLGILDKEIYYLQHNVIYSINCNKVIEIINADGKKLNYDCLSNTYIPQTLNELDVKKFQKQPIIGGTLIAIGGLLLYNNLDNECDYCETAKQVDDFLDEVESTQKIGYIFIILGGIFVALGI